MNSTGPATAPVKVQVNVRDVSPAKTTGRAGYGPDDRTTPPLVQTEGSAMFIPFAAAWPELVTVTVTMNDWPMLALPVIIRTEADKLASSDIVDETVAEASRADVPAQVWPGTE